VSPSEPLKLYSPKCVEGEFCEVRQARKVVALIIHLKFIGAS
jgi:hypothetical protein